MGNETSRYSNRSVMLRTVFLRVGTRKWHQSQMLANKRICTDSPGITVFFGRYRIARQVGLTKISCVHLLLTPGSRSRVRSRHFRNPPEYDACAARAHESNRFSYGAMSPLIDLDRLDHADRMSPLFGVKRAA
jgi:hypothetical protein